MEKITFLNLMFFEMNSIKVSTLVTIPMIMDGSCWCRYNFVQMEDGDQLSKSRVWFNLVIMKRGICVFWILLWSRLITGSRKWYDQTYISICTLEDYFILFSSDQFHLMPLFFFLRWILQSIISYCLKNICWGLWE